MLGNHESVVFQYSGGKDSLACLHLLRPYWDRITVLWCDTGDAFPETHEHMEAVRALVPRFHVVRSDQPGCIQERGSPTDLLPVWSSPLGRAAMPSSHHKVQSAIECCAWNVWRALALATIELKATLVIRGQRWEESRKAPIRSGHVENGIEYLFPIEDWSTERVLAYLREVGQALPDNYGLMRTSLDCQHCTAYLDENSGKLDYLRERHPAVYSVVRKRLFDIGAAVYQELEHLDRALSICERSE